MNPVNKAHNVGRRDATAAYNGATTSTTQQRGDAGALPHDRDVFLSTGDGGLPTPSSPQAVTGAACAVSPRPVYRDTDATCAITLTPLARMPPSDIAIANCGHQFNETAVRESIKKLGPTCPCCRSEITALQNMDSRLVTKIDAPVAGREGQLQSVIDEARQAGRVPCLRGWDLSWLDLRGMDLRGVDFADANLEGAYLRGALLTHANLSDAHLDGVRLGRTQVMELLEAAVFLGHVPNLRGCELRGLDLRGVDFYGADMRRASVQGARLRGANLEGVTMSGIRLDRRQVGQVVSTARDLRQRVNLFGVDLRGRDLHKLDLRGADLRGADLRDSNLQRASLEGADIRGADLRGANVEPDQLRSCVNLEHARLGPWQTIALRVRID